MIEIKDLTKVLGQTKALDGFSAEIGPGINGLVGRNGAGKSTLLRTIADVYKPTQGKVTIDGLPADDVKAKAKLMFLPDEPYAPANAKMKDLISFYSCFYRIDENSFQAFTDKVGLPKDKPLKSFSKGMRRQAFLALALSVDVEYLLLDEAFDGIDPLALFKIKNLIISRYAGNGKTVLVASHNMQTLESLCDTFVLIDKGHKFAQGSGENLGKSFVKYQIAPRLSLTKEALLTKGMEIISFRKSGSVYEIVAVQRDSNIASLKSFEPLLLDTIPIDYSELLTLEMSLAEEKGETR